MTRPTFDPELPARVRTPWGQFELRRTHLRTNVLVCPAARELTPDEVSAARLVVADNAVDTADCRHLLAMLGLAP